jgi:T5SS/PEP-CTERM-associated repeat protein
MDAPTALFTIQKGSLTMAKTIEFSGNGQPGDLLDSKNWDGGVVPGIANSALITINVGGPVSGIFSVNNLMLLGTESITFTGTIDTAGVGACQGVMICEGAAATFAPGAVLNDGGVLIVGNDAAGSLVALGKGTTHSVLDSVNANIGKQDAGIGTVTIDDSVWTDSGHVYVGDMGTGTLNVVDNGAVSFGGDMAMAAAAGSEGKMTIASGGSVTVTGGLLVGGAANDSGTASVKVGTSSSLTVGRGLEVGAGSELDLKGGTVTGGATAGCIGTEAGGLRAGAGVISGYGTLATRAGAPVYDDGIIRASGGSLTVAGNISGEGSVQIAANSVAALTGGALTLAGIAFIGADATLSLAQGAKVTAAIAGFAIGDIIAMAKVDAVSFNPTTGSLVLLDQGAKIDSLHMVGNFAGDTFNLSQTTAGAVITLSHG